jgi:hypothetical protein
VFELTALATTPIATTDSTTTVINTDPPVSPTVTITSAAEACNIATQTIAGTVTSPDATVVLLVAARLSWIRLTISRPL